jgi:hypothetical protein
VSLSDERLAKNEILFREVNERLDDMAASWSKTTDYLCECSETSCVEMVALTNDEYERVRSRATVFVVVPGHERPEIERVVEANEGFMLVENVVAVDSCASPASGRNASHLHRSRRRSRGPPFQDRPRRTATICGLRRW